MVIDGGGRARGFTARYTAVSKRATLPFALVDEKGAANGFAGVKGKSLKDNVGVVNCAQDQEHHDGAADGPRHRPNLRVAEHEAESTKLEPGRQRQDTNEGDARDDTSAV